MSKAYWVNTFREISDFDRFSRYAELAGTVMVAHGGRFLARGNPAAVFEQGLMLRVSIIEFPSVSSAIAAYECTEYQYALRVLGEAAMR